jgi:Fur family ferric uptake transcriptional regulator/Fur family peroxide stress response transcriptional regulator
MSQRNTLQRKIVLDTLMRLENHPTVEELHAEIQEYYPAISKTTIYRNLRILAQNGQVRQVSLPYGPERYEGQPEPHYHFQCRLCGGIYDVDIPVITDIDAHVARKHGFGVDGHDIVFHGICKKCK